MGYDRKTWHARYAERTDLSTHLVHLTKPTEKKKAIEVLFSILESGQLKGSTTNSGFIVGDIPAVCFQDAPLHGVSQNCWFEEKWRKEGSSKKERYIAMGLMLKKRFVYSKGGRPVIYDPTEEAKEYLPENQYWRIVNFNLADKNNIVDWSHEREWRAPNNLKFKLENVTLIFPNNRSVQEFMSLCDDAGKRFYRQVCGMIPMSNIIF